MLQPKSLWISYTSACRDISSQIGIFQLFCSHMIICVHIGKSLFTLTECCSNWDILAPLGFLLFNLRYFCWSQDSFALLGFFCLHWNRSFCIDMFLTHVKAAWIILEKFCSHWYFTPYWDVSFFILSFHYINSHWVYFCSYQDIVTYAYTLLCYCFISADTRLSLLISEYFYLNWNISVILVHIQYLIGCLDIMCMWGIK